MADAHNNFAYSTISGTSAAGDAIAPGTGTAVAVQSGDGTKFPAVPFNATIWPSGVQPTYTGVAGTTAEIVRVTNKGGGDNWTITRLTEDPTQTTRSIVVGDQIAAAVTNKTFTDIEGNYVNSWAPHILQTGTGLATYASTSATGSGSVVIFPFNLPYPVKFNQVMVPVSLNYITSATAETISNSYYSVFGLYSLASNTILSLITSSSFSIVESVGSVSLSWNYPTTTHTSGYGYGSIAGTGISAAAQLSSLIVSSRIIGLQFGTEMSLSGGDYWLGVLQMRSTGGAHSTYGLSNAGFMGQIIHSLNMIGTVNGLQPLGHPSVAWQDRTYTNTAWFGRHMLGFITNTLLLNFGGTRLPGNITISAIGAVGQTMTVLPNITLVST